MSRGLDVILNTWVILDSIGSNSWAPLDDPTPAEVGFLEVEVLLFLFNEELWSDSAIVVVGFGSTSLAISGMISIGCSSSLFLMSSLEAKVTVFSCDCGDRQLSWDAILRGLSWACVAAAIVVTGDSEKLSFRDDRLSWVVLCDFRFVCFVRFAICELPH